MKQAGLPDEARRRSLLERSLTTRFGLRLHMSLMLAAAFAVGLGANFLMLHGGFGHLVLRWVVAYLIGYAVLFVAMRCWLAYVGVRPFGAPSRGFDGDDGGLFSGSAGGGSGGGGSGGGGLSSGGGRFGGGGASADFTGGGGAPPRVLVAGTQSPVATNASANDGAGSTWATSGHGSSGSSSKSGFGFSGGDLLDGDGVKLLVLIAVVVALICAFGGGIVFMIASAPHLLVDVAFGAALTTGVAPAARRVARAVDAPAWQGSVLHATWKPVALMGVVMIACAMVFGHYFPGMSTLGEAWTSLHAPKSS